MSHSDPRREADPQDLLPPEMEASWAVVPRHELYQIFFSGLLFGAGTLASGFGFVSDQKALWFGFPVAYLLARL